MSGLVQSLCALRILGLLGMPKTQSWLSPPLVDPTVLDLFMKLRIRGRTSTTTTVLDSVLVEMSTHSTKAKLKCCPMPVCQESAVLSLARSERLLPSPECTNYLGGYTGMGWIWVSLSIVYADV